MGNKDFKQNMKRTRRKWLTLFSITLLFLFFIYLNTINQEEQYLTMDRGNSTCFCHSNKGVENVCYSNPQNSSLIGLNFQCSSLPIIEKLGLVNGELTFPYISKNPQDVTFVSATSDDHFEKSLTSLENIRKYYPNQNFILYGLNLHSNFISQILKKKNVEFREFNISKYPKFVNNFKQYRFKPLILSEVLLEYTNIWWIDADVKMVKPRMVETFYEELGRRKERSANSKFSSIYMFGLTGHSNFAVLNPRLLSFFPTVSEELLKDKEKGLQLTANMIYVSRDIFSIGIMKWLTLCALDYECLNPPGATVVCNFDDNWTDSYANCFRFDQSTLNLLLLNVFQNNQDFKGSIDGYFQRL